MLKLKKRALLVGHFTTVGDIECLEIVQQWLDELNISYDTAPLIPKVLPHLTGALDLRQIQPQQYGFFVAICGPIWPSLLDSLNVDLKRYEHCVKIGINLTMTLPLESWNPFDILLERDSDQQTRPDLTLHSHVPSSLVVGRCYVTRQASYSGRDRHMKAIKIFDALCERHGFAAVDIDTMHLRDGNGLKTPSHVKAAMERVDLILTNRLHGMIFALKAGTPPIVIDAISGGAKVAQQAEKLGWPACLKIDDLSDDQLDAHTKWALSDAAKVTLSKARKNARGPLESVEREFKQSILADINPKPVADYIGTKLSLKYWLKRNLSRITPRLR